MANFAESNIVKISKRKGNKCSCDAAYYLTESSFGIVKRARSKNKKRNITTDNDDDVDACSVDDFSSNCTDNRAMYTSDDPDHETNARQHQFDLDLQTEAAEQADQDRRHPVEEHG
ncbi:putative DNA-directed RNA polymerase delta chain [Trichinella spiralis]|uniref:putative DNA-directed RNA polymerase delta chain n=1 Tax=Trichinella spiralis TaxID=6334 RepID=UPI0001EFBB12|nr:putative DNA-directed RNA polymerase delta chain [Trichinella spiralis]